MLRYFFIIVVFVMLLRFTFAVVIVLQLLCGGPVLEWMSLFLILLFCSREFVFSLLVLILFLCVLSFVLSVRLTICESSFVVVDLFGWWDLLGEVLCLVPWLLYGVVLVLLVLLFCFVFFCTIHFVVLIDCVFFYLFIFIVLELMIGVLGFVFWNIWYSSFRSGFGIIVVCLIFDVPLYVGILIFPTFVVFFCILFIPMIIIWICFFRKNTPNTSICDFFYKDIPDNNGKYVIYFHSYLF